MLAKFGSARPSFLQCKVECIVDAVWVCISEGFWYHFRVKIGHPRLKLEILKIAPLWYENLIFAYFKPCWDQLFLDFLLHGFVHAFGCYQGPFLEALWAPKWELFRTIFGKNAFKKRV